MSGGISKKIIHAPTIYIGVESPVWTNEKQKKKNQIVQDSSVTVDLFEVGNVCAGISDYLKIYRIILSFYAQIIVNKAVPYYML